MRSVFLNLLFVVVASTATLDRVAVVVGDHVITEGEVMDELRLEEFTGSQPLDLSPDLMRGAADRLIDQQLIRNEMKIAQYAQPEPAAADEMLRNLYKQRFHNQAQFQAALAKYGITEQQLKDYLLWQLATLRFTDERFHPNIPEPPVQSAARSDGAAPVTAAAAKKSAGGKEGNRADTSANRVAAESGADVGGNELDDRLNAWLKQARSSVKVVIKKEAFQ